MHEARDFEVRILALDEVHERPGGWPFVRLQALLRSLDVDDVGDDDAMEMATMALQDLELDEASERVLEVVFGERMRPGVRQNLVPDLQDDRPWEDFAELSQQAGIFDAVVLLQRAFPSSFGKPDAVSLRLQVETGSKRAGAWLDASPVDPGLLLRILAAGMDERTVLRRLFAQPLAADRFPEAASMIWEVTPREAPPPAWSFELVSSHQWLDPLREVDPYSARAWPDVPAGTRD